MKNNQHDSIYFIPVEDKTIIYMPYKPMTFIGNEAMVEWIKKWQANPDKAPHDDTYNLLEQIGFFAPDRRALPPQLDHKPFKPVIGVLLLTTACNLNCVYCYASAGENGGKTMSLETGKRLIDQVYRNAMELKKKRFSVCFHGGGEPTVAQGLLTDLVQYARGKDLECSISLTTNGYFTDEQAERILDGVSEVSYSFDGMPEIQNRQRPARGKPSFDRVFNTLKTIEKRKIPYGIRMSVMDESIDRLPENIDFLCQNTNCRVFQVEPVFKSGRARVDDNYLKQIDAFSRAFMDGIEIAHMSGRHMYYSGVRPWLVTNQFCLAPREALIVNHDGELTMCYEVYDRQHELGEQFFYGHVNNDQEFELDFSRKESLYSQINARQKKCIKKNCYCFPHCAGDCPPKALLSLDDGPTGFSARCELNRNLTKEMLLFYIEKSGGIWRGEKIVRHE